MSTAGSARPATLTPRNRRFSAGNRYGVALALLVLTYIQALWVQRDTFGSASVLLAQLLTVYLVLSVSESKKIRKVAAIAFVLAAAVVVVLLTIGPQEGSDTALFILYMVNIALYAVAPLVIIRHIFLRQVVDAQTFLGAVCAYFMIGMMFAFTYSAIEVATKIPFFTSEPDNPMAGFLFFSFVTITTTGYGDLVPAGEVGQTLAVWEALIGQFFLAAVVAKIVSAWRPSVRRKTADAGADDE
ncbi:MAG: two pore domain potassium channel family protein [Actinobacteria bacterium]|nr:two pore domain potassium channel family protein [Actinomycetota bacterium]